jgi:uncharacterized protein involved in high-affinity Fe2+ transport
MKISILTAAIVACAVSAPMAFGAELKVKTLSPAEDATQKTVLIGRNVADNIIVTLEIEGAEGMWMPMGRPPKWMEQPMDKNEIFHLEVKPVDPGSKTRISYADVKFNAVNRDNKKKISATLHPSWGDSGLHYGYNSPLAGDGTYEATVTVGVPTFGRTEKNKDMWTKPVSTKFHFKLAGKKIVEVTEPAPEPK